MLRVRETYSHLPRFFAAMKRPSQTVTSSPSGVSGPGRPWLGLNVEEVRGRIFVGRVTGDGPAERAGINTGDIVVAVNGEPPRSLADYYRKLWSLGGAGASVPLDLLQTGGVKRIDVKSMNRLDYLRLKSTF